MDPAYILGACILGLIALLAIQAWWYRPSAVPNAMKAQATAELERDAAVRDGATMKAERDQARGEAKAATERAQKAEAAHLAAIAKLLPHVRGDALVLEADRILRAQPSPAATAPAGGGGGDPAAGGVQPPPAPDGAGARG